jgi:hypothetical protein
MSQSVSTDARTEGLTASLPYRVALEDGAVIAWCEHPGVAFSAYYAALREYPGEPLSLRLGDRILASSPRARA